MSGEKREISEDEFKLMVYKLGRAFIELGRIKTKLEELVVQIQALQDEILSAVPKEERGP
jgi:hypothetical protein